MIRSFLAALAFVTIMALSFKPLLWGMVIAGEYLENL